MKRSTHLKSLGLGLAVLTSAMAYGEGNEVIVVAPRRGGERHHPEQPGGHDRPGGGRTSGPPPTTEQRLNAIEKRYFEDYKGADWLTKSIEVWKCSSALEGLDGMEAEKWMARLRGTLYGVHSEGADSIEDAKNRVDIKIDLWKPFTYKGYSIPFIVTKTTVTIKATGTKMEYIVAPNDYIFTENFEEMFPDAGLATTAGHMLLQFPSMNLQDVYDCLVRHIPPTGHPGIMCPVMPTASGGGITGEGL